MFVERLKGSAKSVDKLYSCFKEYAFMNDEEFLTPKEEARLKALRKELKLRDDIPTRRVSPITSFIVKKIAKVMEGQGNLKWDLTVLMISTGHDGLLRSGEAGSGLTPEDCLWNDQRTSCSINFLRTKTCRSGDGQRVTLMDGVQTRRVVDYGAGLICLICGITLGTIYFRELIEEVARSIGLGLCRLTSFEK